jgi:hypothetical protein
MAGVIIPERFREAHRRGLPNDLLAPGIQRPIFGME